MTECRLRDKFCDTGVNFKRCIFYFFLVKYISKLLRFFLFYKIFFLLDFQKYLNLRVVNFSTLKLDEIKLLIFWLFRVQTSKSNITSKLFKI